jgi:hypothetical protein
VRRRSTVTTPAARTKRADPPGGQMRALSVRQHWVELIVLGHETIEVRSRRTNVRGRVYVYAGRSRIEAD